MVPLLAKVCFTDLTNVYFMIQTLHVLAECADFLIEILRISVHQILWARKLYPRAIFRLHKQFSISVQVILPEFV